MTPEERKNLIRLVGEEIIEEDDLDTLNDTFIAYDGFEPSGRIHIAQAVMRAININRMIAAGAKFKMLVADWHAWANHKMGGDLEKIQNVGKYFIEVWKASGMDLNNVDFLWASDLVKDPEYWKLVMRVATHNTLRRILRCTQIMGRSENETLYASQILYPCMQAADIFYLGADVCQLGMDQRKVNVLAREIAPKLGYKKPVIVSHHMLMGLQAPPTDASNAVERAVAMKMSKSKPDTAIFVTDDPEEVARKLKKAYCPEGEVLDNPILEYCRYIIFPKLEEWDENFLITRPEKFGGDISLKNYELLENAFKDKKIHPLDLKKSVIKYVNKILDPIRKHFTDDENARRLKELVESYEVTR